MMRRELIFERLLIFHRHIQSSALKQRIRDAEMGLSSCNRFLLQKKSDEIDLNQLYILFPAIENKSQCEVRVRISVEEIKRMAIYDLLC